jgi:LemA protein
MPVLAEVSFSKKHIMIIVLIVVGALVLYGVIAYNGFVAKVNHVKESWADIDVQLKRRYDLIPNLVNTVKGYATHESSAFENVTKARAAAMSAGTATDKGVAENTLAGALKSVFAIAEAYPDLKANQNFLELQRELSDTENKIQSARRFYNSNVMALNTSIDMFPGNLIAKNFNFAKADYFELTEEAAKEPVAVKF